VTSPPDQDQLSMPLSQQMPIVRMNGPKPQGSRSASVVLADGLIPMLMKCTATKAA
jgi:hypothetical protein